jgi:hypothetical protein
MGVLRRQSPDCWSRPNAIWWAWCPRA